jgi:hypothetical protein
MTTLHQHRAAVAASVPWTLHALAEHVTTHNLPSPSEIQIPGGLFDTDADRRVHISLDSPNVEAWLESIEATSSVHRDTLAGTIHDVYGLANAIRVRLQWFTLDTSYAPPARILTVVATEVDHELCRSGMCEKVLCYCRTEDRCPGTVEPGCSHLGEYVCEDHRSECTDCRSESHSGISAW